MPPSRPIPSTQSSKPTGAAQREQLSGSRIRAAQRRPPVRSQRVNFSADDSDEDTDESDSQGPAERSLNTWLRKSREEAEAVKLEQPVYLKTERGTSQGARGNATGGPSRGRVIDLTDETTDDDDADGGKAKSGTSSQRSTGSRVKGKPATPSGTMDRARVQRMMGGGSGKSENDSIVLLDSEEEEGSRETVCFDAVWQDTRAR